MEGLTDVEVFDVPEGTGAMLQLALCAADETCCLLSLPTTTPPPTDTRRPLSPITHRALLSAALGTKDPGVAFALLMARYKGTATAMGGVSNSRTEAGGCSGS